MRLHTQLLEDLRGRRSAHAALYLHGAIAWPSEPVSEWLLANPGRLIDQEPRVPGTPSRLLAQLDVMAPDDLAEQESLALLHTMRQDLSALPGGWCERNGLAARFLRADRVAAEQNTILDELLATAHGRLRHRRRWTSLRVMRLELTDFRGADELKLVLSSNQTTVLVGVNGSGKTTVLDAAVLLLSHLAAGIVRSPHPLRKVTDEDIMNGRGVAKIAITAALGGNLVTWSLTHTRATEPAAAEERSGLLSLDEEVTRIRGDLDRGEVSLPIAVYYPVNRAVLDIPLRIRTQHLFEPLEAYDGALDGGARNFRLFFEWFRSREDLENEHRIRNPLHRDHQLEAVRQAITSLVPEFSDLRVERAPLEMVVTKGEWTLYVDQLSDGEKCLISMAGDLARRLAMANPFADEPLNGGGVVVIDEIELHLHPGWQRRVVPALEKTFPNCQFIVSTHSPAVLGHVDRDSVFILKPEAAGIRAVRPDVSKGMDANRILEDLLDVPERPSEFKHKIDHLHRLIDEGKTIEARDLHTDLSATLGSSDPSLVKAEVLLRRREASRR